MNRITEAVLSIWLDYELYYGKGKAKEMTRQ
jgi:hypothetical protein